MPKKNPRSAKGDTNVFLCELKRHRSVYKMFERRRISVEIDRVSINENLCFFFHLQLWKR